MSARESVIRGIASRYATSVFELLQEMSPAPAPVPAQVSVQDSALQDEIAENMALLARLIDTSDELTHILRSPILDGVAQAQAIGALLAHYKMHKLTCDFVQVVVKNRRAFALREICTEFANLIADARNEMVAQLRSATPLKAAHVQALKEQLQKIFDKTIIIESETDPSLLGGFVIKCGSRMVDASLIRKLKSLQQAMNEAG